MTQPTRKTAPGPLDPVPFHIPQPFTTELDNGLKVVLFEDKRLPLVSYRLAFLRGDASDPAESPGATTAMSSNLSEGTQTYSSRELAEKIERLGASISASSSDDFTAIAASSLSIYSSDILDLISEILFRPTFPETELDLYKRNTIENLKFQRSQPNFLANEQTARILYGEHPYAKISPTAAEVEMLDRDHLVKIHSEVLIPNNAVLIAVGDIDRDELLSQLGDKFGGWARGEQPSQESPSPARRDRRTLTIVDRPGSAQSNIVLANIALKRNHPDFFAATVMNQVLGAGASSRVFMNLREEKGYTYGAYTRLDAKRLAGDFEATAEVRTAVTGDSLREFFYELNRIRDTLVLDQELVDAKNFLTGVFPIRAETQEGLTNLIVNQQLYELPSDYLQSYREKIDAVTADDVQRVAREYIHPDQLAVVIVGDAGDVLEQAREFAEEIEVFDTDGNRVDVASFEGKASTPSTDVSGVWNLNVDFQGQEIEVKLALTQPADTVSGSIETVLGSGIISNGRIRGNKLQATAVTEIQGQSVDIVVSASVDGDIMTGTLSAAIIPDSLPFEGSRG